MFGWLKSRRRRKLIAQPFPRPWQEWLHRRIWQYQELTIAERDKLHNFVKVMVAEKSWEGCDGLRVSDDMKVTIAGHAALMLLGASDYFFDAVQTVLVFPRPFDRQTNNHGIHDNEMRSGEAWQDGPIVLSWNNVVTTAVRQDKAYNVVIHEFAHHLDGLDGEMGGTPIFDNTDDQEQWSDVMEQEFFDLQNAATAGQWTLLDHYGAQSKAEFFAVSSECFFETPVELRRSHPELYSMLQTYYRIDPVKWIS